MVKPVSVLSATVRLMPSMATEPFSTIYLISALSNVMATSMELSSFLNERIFPCPSTWPSMMCPPRRSQSLSALSRLTGDPGRQIEKDVLLKVSGVTSASKES